MLKRLLLPCLLSMGLSGLYAQTAQPSQTIIEQVQDTIFQNKIDSLLNEKGQPRDTADLEDWVLLEFSVKFVPCCDDLFATREDLITASIDLG